MGTIFECQRCGHVDVDHQEAACYGDEVEVAIIGSEKAVRVDPVCPCRGFVRPVLNHFAGDTPV